MEYFSEKEEGEKPRNQEEISGTAWGGIRALIKSLVDNGSFGATYPRNCTDEPVPTGSDEESLWRAIQAEIPSLGEAPWCSRTQKPTTMDILDLIEFTHGSIGKPINITYDKFWKHYHIDFNQLEGQSEFRDKVNTIFRRNELAYNLTEYGGIERLAPPGLKEQLASSEFRTMDFELNSMLETARKKFLNPDLNIRREGLEKLWDSWERVKTLGKGKDKKQQISELLDRVAGISSPIFRKELENEAKALTNIGNNFQIRHFETTKEKLISPDHVDYCFHRLFTFILQILKKL